MADAARHSSDAGDPARLRRGDRRDRRVPQPDPDAAIHELVRLIKDLPGLAATTAVQIDRLAEFYSRLLIPAAIRDWIDSMITGAGQGGTTVPSSTSRPSCSVLTGAASFIGGIFGYIILPIWVFYLLKDRVALMDSVRPRPAAGLAVRRLGRPPDRASRLRAMGAGAIDPRDLGRSLHLRRPDAVEPNRGSRVRALRRAPVGDRRHPGACARHRADHLGDPGSPARGDRRSRAGHRRPRALHAGPAAREQPAGAQDPGRCDPVASGRGHVRDHHRRIARRPPWGDPCPARDRRRSRCGALPVPQAEPGRPQRRSPHSVAGLGLEMHPRSSLAATVGPGDGSAG